MTPAPVTPRWSWAAPALALSLAALGLVVLQGAVLALSVTVIQVSLIVPMLLSSPDAESSVARDTVFAAIMIMLNGIFGLCPPIGGLRFHEPGFQARGAIKALGVLRTLAVLGLVLPDYTTTPPRIAAAF